MHLVFSSIVNYYSVSIYLLFSSYHQEIERFPTIEAIQKRSGYSTVSNPQINRSISDIHPTICFQLSLIRSLFPFFNSSLNHPNIVRFLGIYCNSNTNTNDNDNNSNSNLVDQYLVTEYLSRGSLVETLQKEKDTITLPQLLKM